MRLICCFLTLVLLAGVVLFLPNRVSAVPAAPLQHELRQADGTVIAARQWGDEFQSGWEAGDGYTILFDPVLMGWTYAGHDKSGELMSSRRLVGRDLPPGHLPKRLRPKKQPDMQRFRTRSLQSISPSGGALPGGSVPFSGSPPVPVSRNIPVILVNFNDTIHTHTPEEFNSLLFGSGTWSMKEYYEEVSSGNFSVASGPAGISAWVTASNGHDYYGQPSGWGPPDKWPGDLAYEAVQQADTSVDFSPFDNDGDCIVDVVAIVHQGPAQEASGNSDDIWSHSWSLSATYYYGLNHHGPSYTTNDRCSTDPSRLVTIDDYIMQPETYLDGITTVGVFAHEYGHALGLIDLYDTDNSSEGVGNWSLMGSGSWGGVMQAGDRPVHLDPWSKSLLGWVNPLKVTASENGRSMQAVETSAAVSQILDTLAQGGSGEYFLLENRQKTGFDAALPGDGLLLWHIDEMRATNQYEWYPGCTSCPSHPKVAMVPADNRYDLEQNINRGDSGDPFPGSTDNRAFTFWTTPASILYGGSTAGFTLTAISNSAPVMTFDVTSPDRTPPMTTITAAPSVFADTSTGSFSFSADETATFACRLDGGAFAPCTSPWSFSGLGEGSHTFIVQATDPAGNQETSPPGHTWTVDTLSPDTAITGKPPDPSYTGSGRFSFTASEAGVTFACSLDNGDFAVCSSPVNLTGLGSGNHTFQIRAMDQAGNVDTTPAIASWRIATCNVSLGGACHATLTAAYGAIPEGTTVTLDVRALLFTDTLLADRNVIVTIAGGYDDGFITRIGMVEVQGSMTIGQGTIIADGLTLR